ncbi:hypothetical protein Bpfe_024767 [Biomphalaria pfeifferi]|uniref:Uncharacterized protein n=1 Tax=Biomphalaria pfeifferi TaxID=112525 RepID=A0AAD8F047_BIOPF|nr:hypothetical protein Bpfe_024767 [Biomphalaria pfeifferi]
MRTYILCLASLVSLVCSLSAQTKTKGEIKVNGNEVVDCINRKCAISVPRLRLYIPKIKIPRRKNQIILRPSFGERIYHLKNNGS